MTSTPQTAPILRVALVQGGTGTSTVRFTQALAVALADHGVCARPVTTDPTRVSHVPGLAKPDDYLRRWIRNPLMVRRSADPIIHLVDDNGPMARWAPGDRTVVTRHDMIPLLALHGEIPYSGPSWYLHRFAHGVRSLNRLAAVACPTETVRDDILRFAPVAPERVHVIPLGVDSAFAPTPDERRDALREQLGGRGRVLVLHIGTGGFYKNAGMPVRVLERLAERGVDCVLLRVGILPPEEPPVPPALASRVVDLGRVSDERLIDLYRAADALLFPSLAEGFGFPLLEAMACGTPVVASDIPALREVGAGAALYAPVDRPEMMADALELLGRDQARRDEIVEAGLRRAEELSWTRAAAAYAALYRRIADRSARRPG